MPARLRLPTLAYAASRALTMLWLPSLAAPGAKDLPTQLLPVYGVGGGGGAGGGGDTYSSADHDPQPSKQLRGEVCESPRQPAHGIGGRAATLVDAFGLICDEP